MHFWIDKRSQGCGFNGRRAPPYITGSRRCQRLCEGVYPKLMVTPVHRFQSIESVGVGSVRHSRHPPGYHARFPIQCNQAVQYVYSASSANNSRSNVAVNRSMEILSTGESSTVTPRLDTQTAKLKCRVWVFFAIVTFFIAGAAKYYFHGGNMGVEALAFCSLLVVVLLVGGLVSLYEAMSSSTNQNDNVQNSIQISNEQNDTVEDSSSQVPNNPSPMNTTELPPPPYHIAIMLPSQPERETLTILRDSPPPSYDKAVT